MKDKSLVYMRLKSFFTDFSWTLKISGLTTPILFGLIAIENSYWYYVIKFNGLSITIFISETLKSKIYRSENSK